MNHSLRNKLEQAEVFLGILFILGMTLPASVELSQRILFCDICMPIMFASLVLFNGTSGLFADSSSQMSIWGRIANAFPKPPLMLTIYVIAALLYTFSHMFFTFSECYEWLVFAYVAVIFTLFTKASFTRKYLTIAGSIIIMAVLLALFYEFLSVLFSLPTLFCFVSEQMESTEMSFLSRRFAFTLGNPNMFGCFYPLPLIMLTPFVQNHDWRKYTLKRRMLFFPICFVLLLPLLFSASKHGLMSLAILASWFQYVFNAKGRVVTILMLVGVLLTAVVFEITVLFTTFPLKSTAPFIDTTPGMYSLHQGTYARMAMNDPMSLLTGLGISRIKHNYPLFTDKQLFADVLEKYNARDSLDSFLAFMDPHNEFLNQLTLFGIIPLLLLFQFLSRTAISTRSQTCLLFVESLLFCCLWDDLLSKRPVWVALALAFTYLKQDYRQQTDE